MIKVKFLGISTGRIFVIEVLSMFDSLRRLANKVSSASSQSFEQQEKNLHLADVIKRENKTNTTKKRLELF